MNSIRIDRERAIKTAALIALVLLTVTFLPELLRSPDPPPVPANVGFSPKETDTGFPLAPTHTATAEPKNSRTVRPERRKAKEGKSRTGRRKKASRLAKGHRERKRDAAGKPRRDRPASDRAKQSPTPATPTPAPAPESGGSTPGPAPATTPAPASSPPAKPRPAPTAVPADPASPPLRLGGAGDGSAEFAPR